MCEMVACRADPMRLLLTLNASVSLRDKREGNTALHWASVAGNRIAVKLLLDAGSDPDAKNGQVCLDVIHTCSGH